MVSAWLPAWNDRGQSSYVCERVRYVRELRLRAPSPLRVGRDREDEPPGDDGARQLGDEQTPKSDAHSPDASVTVPFIRLLHESE